MNELVFLIEDDPDGGLTARALGAPIFTQAEDMDQMRSQIRDAVECHYADAVDRPKVVLLHYVRDEVMAL